MNYGEGQNVRPEVGWDNASLWIRERETPEALAGLSGEKRNAGYYLTAKTKPPPPTEG